MVGDKWTRASFALFESANEESDLTRIYVKYIEPYIDKYTFNTVQEALQEVMVTPKRTFLTNLNNGYPQYQCHLLVAWKSRQVLAR